MNALKVKDCAEFLRYALAIENEAVERYTTFAEQMDVTNNQEVAELFREMARIEGLHAGKITDRMAREMKAQKGDCEAPEMAPWEYEWPHGDSPEAPDFSDTHYLMTPYQALTLVLKAERQAVAFFESVERDCTDKKVREMAVEFAGEEHEHVELVRKWRERYPPPDQDWDEDPDPPNQLE